MIVVERYCIPRRLVYIFGNKCSLLVFALQKPNEALLIAHKQRF